MATADWPTVICECAFTSNPLAASPVWVDISTQVRAFSTRRGRGNFGAAGTRFDPGTATILLDNRDGRFDPTYTSSPLNPNVIPGRRIRLRATYNAVTYPIFDGYVESWASEYEWTGGEHTTVTAVDAFSVLSLYQYTPVGGVPEELSSARVNRVLTAVGLSTSGISTGHSLIIADATLDTGALDHCQAVAETENGAFYIGRDGQPIFEDRYFRNNTAASKTSQGTYGDQAGEFDYTPDVHLSMDMSLLYNAAEVTDGLGRVGFYEDATSETTYLKRTLSASGIGSDPNAAYDQATWIVLSSKDALARFDQIIVEPVFDPTNLWPAVFARDISDRITVKRRPPSGNVISQDCFIEAVNHDATDGLDAWTVTFALSPPRLSVANFLVLGTGKLGDNNTATAGNLGY